MRLTIALAALLLFAPAARAANIHTDAGHVYYDALATDQVTLGVNMQNSDPDLGGDAILFVPLAITGMPANTNPGTNDPANCKASSTLGYKCLKRAEVDINAGDQNDFVRILASPSPVVFKGGGGNDRIFSDVAVRMTLYGEAGDDNLQGNNVAAIDLIDGGAGNDLLDPGLNDAVHGGADFDTVRMPSGGVTVTLDDTANDGLAGQIDNIHSDVEKVVGGADADQLDGSGGPDTLDGADGNDALNGLGGADTLIGNAGNDTIRSRDGVADTVSCGTGDDRAIVDPLDAVSQDCETVEYADDDRDGFDARTDCNDANGAVHPGAIDVAGNGVDEDCNGADAPVIDAAGVVDADHDGTSPPVDCNDSSAAIHPGAIDKPGDGVDQDCSGADAKLAIVGARITDRWTVSDTRARIDRLTIRSIPKGGKVFVDCKGRGCPFKRHSVKVKAGKADAGRLFKGRRLRKGATLQVTVTAPGFVGKVLRYTFKGHRKVPAGKQLCLRPGALSPTRCG
jgi:hypothetical protein